MTCQIGNKKGHIESPGTLFFFFFFFGCFFFKRWELNNDPKFFMKKHQAAADESLLNAWDAMGFNAIFVLPWDSTPFR